MGLLVISLVTIIHVLNIIVVGVPRHIADVPISLALRRLTISPLGLLFRVSFGELDSVLLVFCSIQSSDICLREEVLTIFRLLLVVIGCIIRWCIVVSALSSAPPMRPGGLVVETLLPAGVVASAGLGIVVHHCCLIEERCVKLV